MSSKQKAPKKTVFFENYQRELKAPFIIYAHFESLQVPTGNVIVHQPCGFSYFVKCSYDDALSRFDYYVGEDSPRVLWEKLEEEVRKITQISRTKSEPRSLNKEEQGYSKKINNCYCCHKRLDQDRTEVIHPREGHFLGVAHRKCAQKITEPAFVPVLMYNFGKYGSHFLLQALTGYETESVFLVGKDQGLQRKLPGLFSMRFIDLRQFMDEKMEDLESMLADSKKVRLKKEFKKDKFELMKKKGCFPTYYMDSFEKFQDRCLPNKKGFFDQLHDAPISDEDYQRSCDIWRTFGCSKMRDYFYWYLKSTVHLLEDIFESFRSLCLSKYGLDPAHYYTVSSFSWDAMLRYTRVQLELPGDPTMLNFAKDNIRGGIVQCSKRHAKANNKYCHFDSSKPLSFIVYLDANNLGGWAMSQTLPFSDFQWLSSKEMATLERQIRHLEDEGEYGYILEVDLEYPKELHGPHNDLPFCSDFLTTSYSSEKKPTLNFYNKNKYVIHYRNLKQCLSHGLVLKQVHRVLKFKQCKWLDPYITYNTTLRAKAKTDFEVKLFKLLNNSIYGKTIQRTSNDRPVHAGFTILELSKKFMYDFHYDHMIGNFQTKVNLLYFDTDGAIYEILTGDYYRYLKSNPTLLNMMDTSNLDPRWGIRSINKKVVGKMKEEYGGRIIREFFGVGAKVYFLDVDGEEVKKAVGMKKYVKQKYVSRDDYEACVFKEKRVVREFSETVTEGHVITTKRSRKTVLSPGDRKRLVLADKVHTLALGHQGRDVAYKISD